MEEDIHKSRKMGMCPTNRFENILMKGNFKKYKEILEEKESEDSET